MKIKLIETATFPDGKTKTNEKEFASRFSLEKEFKKNPLPFEVMRQLRLFDECQVKIRAKKESSEFIKIHIRVVECGK